MASPTPTSQVVLPQSRTNLSGAPHVTDVLAGGAEEIQRLGDVLARKRGIEMAEASRVEQVRIQNEIDTIMETARREAFKATRSEDIEPIYREKTKGLMEFVSALPDDDKPIFLSQIARRAAAHAADIDTVRSKMLRAEILQAQDERVSTLSQTVAQGTSEDLVVALEQVDAFFEQQAAQGTIDEATLAQERIKSRAAVQDAYMVGLNSRGLFDTMLDAVNEMPDLPVNRKAQFTASARAGRSERVYTDIGIELEQGADLAATRQKVMGLRAAKVLEEPQVRALLNEIEQRGKVGETSQRAAELQSMYEIYNRTGVLDESLSPKERNAIVTQSFADFAQRNPTKTRAELVADYAEFYNRIPDSYYGQIVGEIDSNNPDAVREGIAELIHLDSTTNGRLFNNTPDFARKAFQLQRAVQRRMFDGDLAGAASDLPGPVVPLEVAIQRTQEVIGSAPGGTDPDELRQTYRKRIEQNTDHALKALSQNRNSIGGWGSFLLGRFTNAFDVDATQVPAGVLRAVTAAAAENIAERKIDPTLATDDDVAAAIDAAAVGLAKNVGLHVSTFNDNSARPEFARPGELMVAAPEMVLPAIRDPDSLTTGEMGMAPYRATLAMSLGLEASRAIAGTSSELSKVMQDAITGSADDTSTNARSMIRGEWQGPLDELLLRDPKPMDLVVEQLNKKRNEAGFHTPFARDVDATWDDVNAGLGIPKGIRWDPVIKSGRDTVLALEHNRTAAPNERVYVPWLVYARDRKTGRDIEIYERSSQVLGLRQMKIEFDNPSKNPNPLTRDPHATNKLAEERRALLESASGLTNAGLLP